MQEFLADTGMTAAQIDRVAYLVGHHGWFWMWRLAERAKRLLNGKITENTPVSFFKLTGVFLGVGVGQHLSLIHI